MTEELPQELGRYRIIRRLGTGGMAEVFLAKSTGAEGIEKVLVLKRVLPSFARSAKFISMFIDEAKVAMRLNHPNIVQVYAFEQFKAEFILAMELVDGLDLGRLVAAVRRTGRKLPPGLAAYVVQEVSKGLDYAHKRKDASGQPMDIVHRDVSPQNVLISYEGVVKVADFGIAKARMVSEETGVIKGKFAYMSPEQARGDRVDHRSDVYSLGILLAELLMGRPMYPGLQGLDVLAKVREAELTLPSDVDSDIPKDLDRIVRRATSADREHRYQTARSLAGALTQYLHGLEKVWDAPPLEDFIREVSPRSQTNPELAPTPLAEGATLLSAVSRGERRERRRVVVVSGQLRRGDTSASGEAAAVGAQAAKVLEAIAYKADAVLSWPDGEGRSRFRFIVGLGKTSVNDPLKAVRIAIDTIEAFQGLSADMLSPIGASLGLSRGMVSTIRDISGRLIRYAPVGTILEVAERLAQAADVNQVLSAGEVYRLVRRDFTFEEEEREIDVETQAGGPSQAIRAWRLRGVRSGARAEPETPKLFGRETELDAISALFREAVNGPQTMFVHVRGEIGAGKSALTGAAVAALKPSRTLFAQCSFGSVDAPFSAVADLIRSAAGVPEDANPAAATERLRILVEKCVPLERRQLVYDGVAPILGAASSIQEDGDHFRLVTRAVEVLIAGLAELGSLIVWVDNLQWADAPSLDVLHAIRQRNHKAPCLVLLVGRAEADLPSALRDIPQVTVGELEGKARAELVQQRFDAVVPTEILQAIEARAGGNPFFLREVVEALLERGAVEVRGEGEARQAYRRPGVPIQLPTTLEGVVAARLDELTNEESHALRWLAVAGAGLQTDEISRLAGVNMRDPIESLEATRLIHQRMSGGLDFPSGVVRQVAYEATDIEDRIR
ncbi:MAG: serine/threonine protein kinase, partial [Polyangiales bacterium]